MLLGLTARPVPDAFARLAVTPIELSQLYPNLEKVFEIELTTVGRFKGGS